MIVIRITAIFLFLMVFGVQLGTPWLSDIWSCIKYGYTFTSKLLEGGYAYDFITDDTGEKLDNIYSAVKDILKEQNTISNRLERRVESMMENLSKDLKNDQQFNALRTKLTNDYIGRIRNAFKQLYNAAEMKYEDEILFNIAEQVTSHSPHEVIDNLDSISLLISDSGSSYFSNFINVLTTRVELQAVNRCGRGSSLQQEVYQLYELLVSTERIAFSTLAFAYSIRAKHRQSNFTNAIKGAETNMIQRTRQYMRIMKQTLAKIPTEIHRCEPKNYIRNENFIEFERLYQLVLIREYELARNHVCTNTCSTLTQPYPAYLAADLSGTRNILIKKCISCESAGKTRVCYPRNKASNYRYFGIQASLRGEENNKIYGNLDVCDSDGEGEYPLTTYDTENYQTFFKCDICLCKCASHEFNLKWRQKLSLKAELSDVSKNMVVTGIRFYRKKLYNGETHIYPQIKVGKLLPDAEVNETEWKEPEFNYVNTGGEKNYVYLGQAADEVKFFNLDDAYALANHVITGVKFLYRNDLYRVRRPFYEVDDYFDDGSSVSIVVRMTRCNFTTGQLFPESSKFGDPIVDRTINSDDPFRPEIWLENGDVPTKATNIRPVSANYAYTRLTISDRTKDFGQSTFPFVDIQPVETSPPVPLSGVGVFLKNQEGYGGFLAFRIMTVNMTNVIDDGNPIPEITLESILPNVTHSLILPQGITLIT